MANRVAGLIAAYFTLAYRMPEFPVRPNDAAVNLKSGFFRESLLDHLRDPLPILRMERLEKPVVAGLDCAWLQPKYAKLFIRPGLSILHKIPIPGSQMRNPDCIIQPCFVTQLWLKGCSRLRDVLRGLGTGGLNLVLQQPRAHGTIFVFKLFSAQLGAQSCLQHFAVARLGNVVVGSGIDALNHSLGFFLCRQNQQRNISPRRRLLDDAASLLTRELRHHQV